MVIKIGAGNAGAQSLRLGDAARTARYAAEAKAAAEKAERSAGIASGALQDTADNARRAEAAAAASVHPPVPGTGGTWLIWDQENGGYIDSGENCRGEKGETGGRGEKGDKGDAFSYADFTPAQLEALRGPQGAAGPKGDKGDTGATGPAPDLSAYRTAAAQDVIDEAQNAEIADLKSATDQMGIGENPASDIWSKGGLTSAGVYSAYAGALNTRRIGYPEFAKCHTESGYYINVGAFDSNNNYLGKYTANGTWGASPANITEFDFSKYPELSFVVTLFNGTSTISLSENVNCIFETEYFASVVPVINGSSSFTELLASGTVSDAFLWHYPVDIKIGDTIIARQSSSTSSSMSLALRKNGQTITTLWDISSGANILGKSAKITMADDADEVLVYSRNATSFEVRRLHSTMTPKANCASTCSNIENIDFLTAQVWGENAVSQNRKAVPEQTLKMFLLDNSYKYFSLASLKQIVDAMHDSGLNALALGFAGGGLGLSFKLNDMTITSCGETYDLSDRAITSSGKYLTESEMEELINYATTKTIEIVPYVGMPGHCTIFLDKYPQFGYRNKSSDKWKSLNVDDSKARDFAYQVAELYLSWFAKHGCKYWIAGTDEFDYPRAGYSQAQSAGNYNYALFINELLFRISKYRMIPLAWNDPYCINDSFYPFLNRNAIVMHWSSTSDGRTTASKISENGNRLVNSSKKIYYVEGETIPSKTVFDNFDVHTFYDGSTISNPLGACFCAWIGTREDPPLDDDGQAIVNKLLPCIGYFGESIASQFN